MVKMNQVDTSRGQTRINGVPVSQMNEDEAKKKLRSLARDYKRVKQEKEKWRNKVKRYLGF
jgi:FtsZ-binding cell division protein ZapB